MESLLVSQDDSETEESKTEELENSREDAESSEAVEADDGLGSGELATVTRVYIRAKRARAGASLPEEWRYKYQKNNDGSRKGDSSKPAVVSPPAKPSDKSNGKPDGKPSGK